MLTKEKSDFLAFMVESDVLRFGSFVTKSGRESPYFVNTGNYRTGRQLAALGKFYAALVHRVLGEGFSAMFGPAYKGIPLAAACAIALSEVYHIDKPYFFNRKEEKAHGEGGSLIGYTPVDGDRVILIEDVVTAGTTIREVLPLVHACGDVQVTDMFISVDRMEYGLDPGKSTVMEVSEAFGVSIHAIVTAADIRAWMAQRGSSAGELKRMDEYLARYCV